LREYGELGELARRIDELGDFYRYELFNVDVSIPLGYMLEKKIFPMAYVELNGGFNLLDDASSTDYKLPDLKCINLGISVKARKKISTFEDVLQKVFLDEIVLEGDEESLLTELQRTVEKINPDIIYTVGGDTYIFPYLYHRSEVNEIDFYLGREKEQKPGKGKSYFTYGRVKFRPPRYMLSGRLHIDKANSFIHAESGLDGLVELSRLSRIPVQMLSRVTPGTAITAMQINQAINQGVLIRWKKNVPEKFKTAEKLFIADRGALIYNPIIGIHEDVVELDFASLYPNIMVKHNISPETVLCDCCRGGGKSAPIINYNICEKKGLIPAVLEPLIKRRMEYKRRIKDKAYSNLHGIYKRRATALKWVLVTCFGYTGYRNARFGRVECHEAINAYAREILLEASEIAQSLGYEILHGMVDSLWLKGEPCNNNELCDTVARNLQLPVEIEFYRWIVFLPNKKNHVGALNRYYGVFENGEMKVRGIDLRRSDMCELVKNAQVEMLRKLARARSAKEFYECIPAVLDVLRKYADKLRRGEVDLRELVFTSTISKSLHSYRQFNNNVASLLQLKESGVHRNAGQTVQYIILDSGSRKYHRRVRVLELIDGEEKYDSGKYISYLVRACENILLPFGYTERRLWECLSLTAQTILSSFCGG
jgi:DNA polymerase elongation subunit (family B)